MTPLPVLPNDKNADKNADKSADKRANNGANTGADTTLELVDVIDLKWLMARDGHHVHVERLLADTLYAQQCLASAAGSKHEAIRNAAQRIRGRLGLPPQSSS